MAQYKTQRRTLTVPEGGPPPPTIAAAAITSKTSSHPTTKFLDPTKPFYMSHRFSGSNSVTHHKIQKPTNLNRSNAKDIHMQAKSMALSADSGSITKPKFQLPQRTTKNLAQGEKLPKNETFPKKRSPKGADGKKEKKEVVGMKKKDLCHVKVEEGDEKNVEASRVSVSLVGRRRSLNGSRVELGDILANYGVRVVSVDMPQLMQIHAVDFTRKIHDSLEKFSSKTLALSLKKEFDGVYGGAWHCIVGTSFGSFVTHSVGGFLYFSMDQKLFILLFKTSVQRAD